MNESEYIMWAKKIARNCEAFLYVLYLDKTEDLFDSSNLIIDLDGQESFTNKVDWKTHIGITGIALRYREFINNEEQKLADHIWFTILHEICHLEFTEGISYKFAVQQGTWVVYQKIASSVAGYPVQIQNELDFESWKNRIRDAGVSIPENCVESIVAGIANSLCDGRIERIKAASNSRFDKLRQRIRWEDWLSSEREYPEYSLIEQKPAEKLQIIANQILSLAKCQTYQRGFGVAYSTTPLLDEVLDLYPIIIEGYLARSTEGMAEACIKICSKLSDLIFKAIKSSEKDAEEMEALKQLIEQLPADFSLSAVYRKKEVKGAEDPEGINSSDSNPSSKEGTKKRQNFSEELDEEAILRQMIEAANSNNIDMRTMANGINMPSTNNIYYNAKHRNTGKPQPIKPVTPDDVRDICPKFIELRRRYELDQKLPADLKSRAKFLRRDTERYFSRFNVPDQRFLREGILDSDALVRLAMKDTRVFMRKGRSNKINCCYYILLDNSGSTGGKHGAKRMAECQAAAIQEEAYKGIIPMKIVAYDDYYGCVVHEVIKDWEENTAENCCYNFGNYGRDGFGNKDYFDIAIATRELMSRKERNRMLVVLSDGAPGDNEEIEATRKAIEAARKKGIKVVGIYFEEGEVQYADDFVYMYQFDYITCAMNELESHLTKVIRKFSLR